MRSPAKGMYKKFTNLSLIVFVKLSSYHNIVINVSRSHLLGTWYHSGHGHCFALFVFVTHHHKLLLVTLLQSTYVLKVLFE